MAYVPLQSDAPGIRGLLLSFPETGQHLNGLAQAVLRRPSSLSPGERETIAAYVSSRNECIYCTRSHAAAARRLLGERRSLVDRVLSGEGAGDEKLQALLDIADKVRRDGRLVNASDIERARRAGADDVALHDTVLIAAAFSMYNRYVDGLGTEAPASEDFYDRVGERLVSAGYRA